MVYIGQASQQKMGGMRAERISHQSPRLYASSMLDVKSTTRSKSNGLVENLRNSEIWRGVKRGFQNILEIFRIYEKSYRTVY